MAKSELALIRDYFLKPDQTASSFLLEVKKLTASDRAELARGIAQTLGLRQADVTFPLS